MLHIRKYFMRDTWIVSYILIYFYLREVTGKIMGALVLKSWNNVSSLTCKLLLLSQSFYCHYFSLEPFSRCEKFGLVSI